VAAQPNTADTGPAIDVRELTKNYGPTRALRGLTVQVERGQTVALIGPNGAGKSSFVEIVMGLRQPDGGSVQVLGHDVVANPRAHVHRIGVQLQESRLFPRLKVREYFEFFRGLYPRHVDIAALCEEMALATLLDKRVAELSGGQRQRVALALALINDPEMVILDEPTVGLDPIVRREFWELIRRQRDAGKTVLFTTHYMDEAQALASSVLMISEGQLVAQGSAQQIIAAAGVGTLDEAYSHFARQAGQRPAPRAAAAATPASSTTVTPVATPTFGAAQ
jgi:ABC-2 type transport system ATP-binding protein